MQSMLSERSGIRLGINDKDHYTDLPNVWQLRNTSLSNPHVKEQINKSWKIFLIKQLWKYGISKLIRYF